MADRSVAERWRVAVATLLDDVARLDMAAPAVASAISATCSRGALELALQSSPALALACSAGLRSDSHRAAGSSIELPTQSCIDAAALEQSASPSCELAQRVTPNPSLERTATGKALGPRSRPVSSSVARAKRLAGVGRSAQTLGVAQATPMRLLAAMAQHRTARASGTSSVAAIVAGAACSTGEAAALASSRAARGQLRTGSCLAGCASLAHKCSASSSLQCVDEHSTSG